MTGVYIQGAMFKRKIKTLRSGVAAIALALAIGLAPNGASALQPADQTDATPISPALIERVKTALAQCKYGFMRQIDGEATVISPSLLTPTLEAMGRNSAPELLESRGLGTLPNRAAPDAASTAQHQRHSRRA